MEGYAGVRNAITFAELISTVVSALAVVPTARRRQSKRSDVSQADVILNVVNRLMVVLEIC